jgi:hypothetical protein
VLKCILRHLYACCNPPPPQKKIKSFSCGSKAFVKDRPSVLQNLSFTCKLRIPQAILQPALRRSNSDKYSALA